MIRFEWLKENTSIWKDIKETRLKCFENDLMRDFDIDIYENIAKGIIKDSDYSLVKNDSNEVVGTIGYYKSAESNYCWMNWFGILKEYRNKGYGKKTLEEFEKYIKNKGVKTIYLYTGKEINKEAVKLYRKCGYIMQEEVFAKGIEHDLVIMGKSLYNRYRKWDGEPIW